MVTCRHAYTIPPSITRQLGGPPVVDAQPIQCEILHAEGTNGGPLVGALERIGMAPSINLGACPWAMRGLPMESCPAFKAR